MCTTNMDRDIPDGDSVGNAASGPVTSTTDEITATSLPSTDRLACLESRGITKKAAVTWEVAKGYLRRGYDIELIGSIYKVYDPDQHIDCMEQYLFKRRCLTNGSSK